MRMLKWQPPSAGSSSVSFIFGGPNIAMLRLSSAPEAFKLLDGLFCVYKPPNSNINKFRENVLQRIADDLNRMEQRPIKPHVYIEKDPHEDGKLSVVTKPSWADHPLVVGPRFTTKNIQLEYVNKEDYHTSGLVVFGIGSEGVHKAYKLKHLNYLKTYEISGQFGKATNTFFTDGRVTERTTANKKSMIRPRLDQAIHNMVASFRTNMIRSMGLEPDSQSAYELLSTGPVRPIHNKTDPIVFNLRCTYFKVPDFTLRAQVLNTNETYLGQIVHTLGFKMRSTACVVKMRCLSMGKFNTDLAILDKYVGVESVIENVYRCKDVFKVEESRIQRPNVTAVGPERQ